MAEGYECFSCLRVRHLTAANEVDIIALASGITFACQHGKVRRPLSFFSDKMQGFDLETMPGKKN